MNSKARLSSLLCGTALSFGLVGSAQAQYITPTSALNLAPARAAGPYKISTAKLPKDRFKHLDWSGKIRRIDNGLQKQDFTGNLYDNSTNVTGTTYFGNSATFFAQDLLDDFQLPIGVASAASPATVTGFTFPVVNTSAAGKDVYVAVYFYNELNFSATDVAGTPISVGGFTGYAFHLTGANQPIPVSQGYYNFGVTLNTPFPVNHDLRDELSSTAPIGRYGYEIFFASDSGFTTADTDFTTVFRTTNGPRIGESFNLFYADQNADGVFDGTTEGFGLTTPGTAGNIRFRVTGTSAATPTAHLNGQLAFPDVIVPSSTVSVAPLPVVFTLRSQTGKPDQTYSTTLRVVAGTATVGGSIVPAAVTNFSLVGAAEDTYIIHVKPAKFLAVNLGTAAAPIDATAGNVNGLTASFVGGDAVNDNVVDIADFGVLVNVYGDAYDITAPTKPSDVASDFNGDGVIDIGDFGILVNNYGNAGDQ